MPCRINRVNCPTASLPTAWESMHKKPYPPVARRTNCSVKLFAGPPPPRPTSTNAICASFRVLRLFTEFNTLQLLVIPTSPKCGVAQARSAQSPLRVPERLTFVAVLHFCSPFVGVVSISGPNCVMRSPCHFMRSMMMHNEVVPPELVMVWRCPWRRLGEPGLGCGSSRVH